MSEHDEDAIAKRIAAPLRAPLRADETFEPRVMSAVRAEVRAHEKRSWWLRPREFRLAPLTGLAMAAGLAALMFIGGSMLPRTNGDAVAATHVVRFVLVDTAATQVTLVGGFNQWTKDATPLRGVGTHGAWVVEIELPAGRHEYAFVVTDARGERWVADPGAETILDEFDTQSSVISVGRRATS